LCTSPTSRQNISPSNAIMVGRYDQRNIVLTNRPPLLEERSRRRSGPRERVRYLYVSNLTPTVKDKANHAVVLDKATADKLYKDVQSYRLITVAVLVDRLKINGSVARKVLKDLEEKGQIKKVVGHSSCLIYSRSLLSLIGLT
jgi:small subunit ribosomal protein S25e